MLVKYPCDDNVQLTFLVIVEEGFDGQGKSVHLDRLLELKSLAIVGAGRGEYLGEYFVRPIPKLILDDLCNSKQLNHFLNHILQRQKMLINNQLIMVLNIIVPIRVAYQLIRLFGIVNHPLPLFLKLFRLFLNVRRVRGQLRNNFICRVLAPSCTRSLQRLRVRTRCVNGN